MSVAERDTAAPQGVGLRAGPGLFDVEVDVQAGEIVLTLHGELDLFTQPVLAAALADLHSTFSPIVLDVSDLAFIDASSIGLIVRARMLARRRGSDLVLRSPRQSLLRLLSLMELDLGSPSESSVRVVAPMN